MAFSRNAAPTEETLNPSLAAVRANSAFTPGFTQRVRWTVFRCLVFPLWGRGVFVFFGVGRMVLCGGAGCGVAVRAVLGVGLSCRTPRSSCATFTDRSRRGNASRDNWVGAVFTICSLYATKQAGRNIAKIRMRGVRVLNATISCVASDFSTFAVTYTPTYPLPPLPLSLIILSPGVTLGTPVSFALLVRCFAS